MLLGMAMACQEEPIPVPPSSGPPATPQGVVAVYRTNGEGSLVLARAPDSLPLVSPTRTGIAIPLDAQQTYQEMEGFGAALTESSALVLMEHLSDAARAAVLADLFAPEEGIGISYLRLTMGASDFARFSYTYHDLPIGQTDTSLQQFSLGADLDYVVPVLKEILAIAPDLRIMATPWTAPAWMKTNERLIDGGNLNPSFYAAYAQYFVRYVAAMAAEGIPIAAITVQNEPLHQAGYPTMLMSAAEQLVFIRDYLGPAFARADLDTKIIIYDHNWDEPGYPLEILADPVAKQYIWGSAFHCYAGQVEAMSIVRQAHPDRGIFFTECSGGGWSTDFGANLAWNMDNLFVGATRNWAKTVLLWNLALDEQAGPQNGGCGDCRGVITVNATSGQVTRNVEYYLLGHFAGFVRPGAFRIETPATRSAGLSQVAFQNPDLSRVLVAFNHRDQALELEVQLDDNRAFRYTLPARTLATFHWKE